ncbi:MAG: hypothetical protein U1E46_17415 [Hyphomicrobiales bacterium]
MIGVARTFLIASILFGLAGMLIGLMMGISGDHSVMPAHAHVMVLGWLSFAVFAVLYHLFPAAARSLWAKLHCGLALVSAAVMFVAVYLIHGGIAQVDALAGISSIAYAVSFVLFAIAMRPAL